jgi:enolase-phosphatase E1
MIELQGGTILLDIEGTVSPLAFVHEVMFPYARKHVASFLAAHFEEAAVRQALDQMAQDAGRSADQTQAFVVAEVHRLMDADAKATGLKMLQGLIWEEGFASGELRSTLFDDVPATLDAWASRGVRLGIYSSGSVHAQRLFFGHTQAGDLTPRFERYFDTTVGPKKSAASYHAIADQLEASPVLFISDVAEELDAAREAGMLTALAVRPGNKPQPEHTHPVIHSFADIRLA